MEHEYDLAKLAEDLSQENPEITELYLFGSRARGTRSTRSDADVLVISNGHIKPHKLREFSSTHCDALDLFVVDGAKAVSSQNESFIEAEDLPSLLKMLGAVKIWSRSSGREAANIEWRFHTKEGIEFEPTVLPNTHVTQGKENTSIEAGKLTIKQILGSLTTAQAWKVGTAVVAILTFMFFAGFKLGQLQLGQVDTPSSDAQQGVPAARHNATRFGIG